MDAESDQTISNYDLVTAYAKIIRRLAFHDADRALHALFNDHHPPGTDRDYVRVCTDHANEILRRLNAANPGNLTMVDREWLEQIAAYFAHLNATGQRCSYWSGGKLREFHPGDAANVIDLAISGKGT
jgi:hypothetical protein